MNARNFDWREIESGILALFCNGNDTGARRKTSLEVETHLTPVVTDVPTSPVLPFRPNRPVRLQKTVDAKGFTHEELVPVTEAKCKHGVFGGHCLYCVGETSKHLPGIAALDFPTLKDGFVVLNAPEKTGGLGRFTKEHMPHCQNRRPDAGSCPVCDSVQH